VEHRSLLSDIARLTECVPEWPMKIEKARGTGGNRYFFDKTQRYGRHTARLYFPREQSNGPRADRSGGYEQGQVDARFADVARNFLDRRHQPPGAAHQSETVMVFCQLPDHMLI